jgi:hypothetical protein
MDVGQIVKITANAQGVRSETCGLIGIVTRLKPRFAEIEFENEFGVKEQWYFEHTEYKKYEKSS